jgi:Mg-chelatase subunit ChlD
VKVEVADGANDFVDLADPNSAAAAGRDDAPPLLDSACVTDTRAAEKRRVAMYVMLDSSGSMVDPTGTGATKWQAVQRAIRSFLVETRSSDLSIGLQFFPLAKPGSKFVCETQEDCGPDGGPCFLSTCLQGGTISLCRSDADCPGSSAVNPCVKFGLCEGVEPPVACQFGTRCENNVRCVEFERTCTQATQCEPAAYATPAVEIGTIEERLVEIDQTLSAHEPQGLTPTAPALEGAIQHSREWALAHPDQTVVTVLATDGLPSECGTDPTALPPLDQVTAVASAAARDPQLPIRTFVIGVFQAGDGTSINNVNAIARAGGTDVATFIDTSGEVETQFLEALRAVSSGTLACQLQVPESEKALDYLSVNLEFNDGTTRRQLSFVQDEAGCAASPNSWHYDVDPNVAKPTAIEVCPGVCDQFKAASTGSISLQLGCATIIR